MTTTATTAQESTMTAIADVTMTNVDSSDADWFAEFVNRHVAEGCIVTVNGRKVTTRHSRKPATTWMNGTFSVNVEGRSSGKVGDVFVKQGETAHIVVA